MESNEFHSVAEFQRYVVDQLKQMRMEIADNTTLTLQTHDANKGVLDLFNTYTNAIKILRAVQGIAVWVIKVAGACVIVWAAFRFGVQEAFEHIRKP